MITILSSNEVKKYSVVDSTYKVENLCTNISIYEQTAFNNCLTLDLYEELIEDLNIIPEHEDYYDSKTYDTDEYTSYHEIVYKSLEDDNNEVPGSSKWLEIKKFKTTIYNTLFDKYLKIYLANYIVAEDIIFTTANASNKGLVSFANENNQATTDNRLFHIWQRSADKLVRNTMGLMKLFMEENEIGDINLDCDNCGDEDGMRIAFFE